MTDSSDRKPVADQAEADRLVSVAILTDTVCAAKDRLRWRGVSKRIQRWQVEDPPNCDAGTILANGRRRVLLNWKPPSRDAAASPPSGLSRI